MSDDTTQDTTPAEPVEQAPDQTQAAEPVEQTPDESQAAAPVENQGETTGEPDAPATSEPDSADAASADATDDDPSHPDFASGPEDSNV